MPDTREETLAAVLAEHRRNDVPEPQTGVPHHWRVKCDGQRCDFYAEAPCWWDVCALHEAHFAAALVAALDATPDPGFRLNGEVWVDHGHPNEPCSPPEAVRGLVPCRRATPDPVVAALDEVERRCGQQYDSNQYSKFRTGLGRAIRIIREVRAEHTTEADDGER